MGSYEGCPSSSSSLEEASKLTKYGSKSSSDRFFDSGGKRPNIWGPGVVWAAAEGKDAWLEGEVGVPEDDVAPDDFNFADAAGTRR